MAFDAHSNFGYSTVAVAPVPPLAGLSLTVQAGQGALFPAAPFNCTVWPAGVQPLASNAEIVRVTAVVGDVLTIVRAQEGSAVVAIDVGFQIANTTSVKVFTDIENAIPITFVSFISAPGGSASAGVQFDNANGVTFGIAGQTVTASVNAAAGGSINFSAGTTSNDLASVTFDNANGITFGLNAGTITASHNGLTTFNQSTQPVAASASNGSFLFSTLNFSNANGLTFGTSAGGIITASHNGITSQSVQPVAASASNGSFLFSTLAFSNANNVTFGTSAGSIITASIPAGAAAGSIAVPGTTFALGQLVFSNSNNVSFGINGSTLTASASNAQTVQPVAASASNGSFLFSTLNFSNANNVTFGTSAGGIITASVNTAAGGITNINLSAGTTSQNLSNFVLSNSNGIVFGLNGSTVTAAAVPLSRFEYAPLNHNATAYSTMAQNSIYFDPIVVDADLAIGSARCLASWNHSLVSSGAATSGQHGLTRIFGVYSRSVTDSGATNFSNSNNWVTMWSASATTMASWSASASSISASYSWQTNSTGGTSSTSFSSNSANFTVATMVGQKMMLFPYSTSMSAGEYIVAQGFSSSTAGGASASSILRMSQQIMTMMSNASIGRDFCAASNTSSPHIPGLGVFSVTSGAFPTSLHTSQIAVILQRRVIFFEK